MQSYRSDRTLIEVLQGVPNSLMTRCCKITEKHNAEHQLTDLCRICGQCSDTQAAGTNFIFAKIDEGLCVPADRSMHYFDAPVDL